MSRIMSSRLEENVTAVTDRIFFSGMAVLLSASVILGFAKSYFLVGFVHAPLPSKMIHVHGLVFSLWFVVLLVQAFLIPAGRVHWHRKLGLVSYGVAVLVVLFGVLAAVDSLRRGVGIGSFDPSISFAISMMDMVAFGIVIFSSYAVRFCPSEHKRLVLYATLSLMDAAFDRWPYERMGLHFSAHVYIYYCFLLLPILYDFISIQRIHRSTFWAFLVISLLHEVRIPIGSTHLWRAFSSAVAG